MGDRSVGPDPPPERGGEGRVSRHRGGPQGRAHLAVSDVATTYFQLRELDEELVIAQKTVDAFRETSELFDRKLKEGAASALETSYASAAYNQVAATVPEIERQIEATENQLSLLLGHNPAAGRARPRAGGPAPASRDSRRAAVRAAAAAAGRAPGRAGADRRERAGRRRHGELLPDHQPDRASSARSARTSRTSTRRGRPGRSPPASSGRSSREDACAATTTRRTRSGSRPASLRADGDRRVRGDDDRALRARQDRRVGRGARAHRRRLRRDGRLTNFATTAGSRTTSRSSTRCSSSSRPRSRSRARA